MRARRSQKIDDLARAHFFRNRERAQPFVVSNAGIRTAVEQQAYSGRVAADNGVHQQPIPVAVALVRIGAAFEQRFRHLGMLVKRVAERALSFRIRDVRVRAFFEQQSHNARMPFHRREQKRRASFAVSRIHRDNGRCVIDAVVIP